MVKSEWLIKLLGWNHYISSQLQGALAMYSTVLPVTLLPLTPPQLQHLLSDGGLLCLHDALAAVPDPRSCHGRRHDLPFLLTCFVVALLCNCTHSEAVGQWGRAHPALLRPLFGPRRWVAPTGALYRWIFPQLDVLALEGVLAA
jgi:hypothetical protein